MRDPGAVQGKADKVPPTPVRPIPPTSEPPRIDRPSAPGTFAKLGMKRAVAIDTVLQRGTFTLRVGWDCLPNSTPQSDYSISRPSQPASDNATYALWPAGALPKKRKISDPRECPGAPT